jgi:hypothetical protein
MHRFIAAAIALSGVCSLASCAPNPPPPSSTANLGQTEGTVSFTGGAFAVGIGFQWGTNLRARARTTESEE